MKGRCLNHLTKEPRYDVAEESGRGEGIRTPGPMLPKHVRYQTALHPVTERAAQATLIIIHKTPMAVKGIFKKFYNFFDANPQTLENQGLTPCAACKELPLRVFDPPPL